MERFDGGVVIGAGIVGLSTALNLAERRHIKVMVVEAESHVAQHQSGKNSGVLHSGIYYSPGSWKAKLCVEGRHLMEDFCNRYKIPYRRTGKYIVARRVAEVEKLEELKRRGEANGLQDLRLYDAHDFQDFQPSIRAQAALYVPETGLTDFRMVTEVMGGLVKERGGNILFHWRVNRVERSNGGIILIGGNNSIHAPWVVNCAGLYADRLARSAEMDVDVRIIPFRGEYRFLTGKRQATIRCPLYPVPDLRLPFLGVHFTPTLDGRVLVGPNAVLAFHREGYQRGRVSVRDCLDMGVYPGFWRLIRRYSGVGLREWMRSFSSRYWIKELRSWIPDIQPEELGPTYAGVRAQAVHKKGTLVDDFVLVHGEGMTHVLNAPSPAATASLAIGRVLAEEVLRRWLG